jgi:hypothetical protein
MTTVYPDIEQLFKWKQQGLLRDSSLFKFISVCKGEWEYSIKIGELTAIVQGGRATHEDAYHLNLDAKMPLSKILEMMGDDEASG